MKLRYLLLVIMMALLGHGRASAQSFVISSTNLVSMSPDSLVLADVNGDGKLDIVTAQYGEQTLTIYTNNGNGTFTACSSNNLNGGAYPYGVAAADFSHHGKMDLVSLHEGFSNSGHLTLLTNNGTGHFVPAYTNTVIANSPLLMAAGDLNGDQKPDLVAAASWTNSAIVLLNSPALPSLGIQSTSGTLNLSWSAAWPGFGLQQTPALVPPAWSGVTNSITTTEGTNLVMISLGGTNEFYRLVHP